MALQGGPDRLRHGYGDPPKRSAEAAGLRCPRLPVALFVIVISLPLAATVAGVDGADAAAENRELARLPRVEASWRAIAT